MELSVGAASGERGFELMLSLGSSSDRLEAPHLGTRA
jgi:hypothetical protein